MRRARAHDASLACFAAHDWEALAEILADEIAVDDRRAVVNSGLWTVAMPRSQICRR